MNCSNLFLALCMLLSCSLEAQESEKPYQVAQDFYAQGDYQAAAKEFDALSFESIKDPEVFYQAAVSFAQTNAPELSIRFLRQAIVTDYYDAYFTELRFDFLFFPIHHTSAWKQLLHDLLNEFEEEAQEINFPQYRVELLELWKTDQYYRGLIFGKYNGRPTNELSQATEAMDRFNTLRLEELVREIGWPTYQKVGRDGAHAAWNIIQHAVFNPPLMKICLEKMKTAWIEKQVDGIDYAYLYDRFNAVCTLGQQDYGIVHPVPVRDAYLVDQRRKEAGFQQTILEYNPGFTPRNKEEGEKFNQSQKEKYKTEISLGEISLDKGEYEDAMKHYNAAMRCYGFVQTEDIYNCARVYGLMNTPRTNFKVIQRIRNLAARGFEDFNRLENDSAFTHLKEDANWKEALAIIKKYNVSN